MLSSPSSQYQYSNQESNWSFSFNVSNGHSAGPLSSLLNLTATSITGGYSSSSPPQPAAINTYTSFYALLSRGYRSTGPVSLDSRPTFGGSASLMSTLPAPYEDRNTHFWCNYSRPGSGHHCPPSPMSSLRPPSPKPYASSSTLSIRRERRHSQARMLPYPSPYSEHPSQRPSSPRLAEAHAGSGTSPRVRSMIQFPPADNYSFYPAHGDFACAVDEPQQQQQQYHNNRMYGVPSDRTVRPGASALPLSTTSSAVNTSEADGCANNTGLSARIR